MPRLNVAIEGLDRLSGSVKDAIPTERELNVAAADAVAEYTKKHYRAEQDPFGRRWQPNAPLTIALKGHDTVMVNSGATRDSIEVRVNNKSASVFVGDNRQDLRVHQYGTPRIPQRQILYDPKVNATPPQQYQDAVDTAFRRLL
ncbi:MAG: phage virion morphogenesis protein [Deinococcota bacterium]